MRKNSGELLHHCLPLSLLQPASLAPAAARHHLVPPARRHLVRPLESGQQSSRGSRLAAGCQLRPVTGPTGSLLPECRRDPRRHGRRRGHRPAGCQCQRGLVGSRPLPGQWDHRDHRGPSVAVGTDVLMLSSFQYRYPPISVFKVVQLAPLMLVSIVTYTASLVLIDHIWCWMKTGIKFIQY